MWWEQVEMGKEWEATNRKHITIGTLSCFKLKVFKFTGEYDGISFVDRHGTSKSWEIFYKQKILPFSVDTNSIKKTLNAFIQLNKFLSKLPPASEIHRDLKYYQCCFHGTNAMVFVHRIRRNVSSDSNEVGKWNQLLVREGFHVV